MYLNLLFIIFVARLTYETKMIIKEKNHQLQIRLSCNIRQSKQLVT